MSASVGKSFGDATSEVESPEVDAKEPALWRTLHIEFAISEVLAGQNGSERHVRVGLAIDGAADTELMIEGLLSLGDLVLFLGRSPVFAYDPDLYWIVGDGALLAEVSQKDTADYTLIFLPEPEAAALQGGVQLEKELRQP